MKLVNGTDHDGQVRLDGPVDWPEGSSVPVQLAGRPARLTEDNWPRDAAAIESLLINWGSIQPLFLTVEERAEFAAARKMMGQISTAKLNARVDES